MSELVRELVRELVHVLVLVLVCEPGRAAWILPRGGVSFYLQKPHPDALLLQRASQTSSECLGVARWETRPLCFLIVLF